MSSRPPSDAVDDASATSISEKPAPSTVASRARESVASTSNLTGHRIPPTRVPFFGRAAQPEIVRANQKDLYYLSQLTERFEDVSRSLLGTRWLQKWSKELTQGSRLAYFGLTTLLGSQTLGEEYCDIMQYAASTKKPPSARRRALLLSLHIFVPYLLSRSYSSTRRLLLAHHESNERTRLASDSLDSLFTTAPLPPPQRSLRQRVIDYMAANAEEFPSFETITEDYLRSMHLAVFYLWGRYYNLSKRAAGIRLISTQARRSTSSSSPSMVSPPSSYEVLGVLMAVQLIVRTTLAIIRRRAAAKSLLESSTPPAGTSNDGSVTSGKKSTFTVDGQPLSTVLFDPDDPEQAAPYPEEEEGEGARDRRCTLCLGTRRDATATECGHVFCWECIVGWAREKPECPLCRQGIQLSKLLPIYGL